MIVVHKKTKREEKKLEYIAHSPPLHICIVHLSRCSSLGVYTVQLQAQASYCTFLLSYGNICSFFLPHT